MYTMTTDTLNFTIRKTDTLLCTIKRYYEAEGDYYTAKAKRRGIPISPKTNRIVKVYKEITIHADPSKRLYALVRVKRWNKEGKLTKGTALIVFGWREAIEELIDQDSANDYWLNRYSCIRVKGGNFKTPAKTVSKWLKEGYKLQAGIDYEINTAIPDNAL